MSCKLLLVICALVCVAVTLEAASLRVLTNADNAVHKLDYEGVKANVRRGSRQAQDDASGEDSDEDDDEDDAEQLQQSIIQQQQAQEQAANGSEESSDEDDEDNDEEDDDDDDGLPSFFGRRRRRRNIVAESEVTNEIIETPEAEEYNKEEILAANTSDFEEVAASAATPTGIPSTPNTSVLILIRDAIKKVTTEIPNSQQVAASASQYFHLFEYFLQQTIEQVIGVDDEEDEAESNTIAAMGEEVAEAVAAIAPAAMEGDKGPVVAAVAEVVKEPMENMAPGDAAAAAPAAMEVDKEPVVAAVAEVVKEPMENMQNMENMTPPVEVPAMEKEPQKIETKPETDDSKS